MRDEIDLNLLFCCFQRGKDAVVSLMATDAVTKD